MVPIPVPNLLVVSINYQQPTQIAGVDMILDKLCPVLGQ